MKDSEGAYSQLIRLQDLGSKEEHRRPTSTEIHTQSNQIQQTISRDSFFGNSSRHSFSVPFHNEEDKEPTPKSLTPSSLSRIIAMSKPEVPVLLLGCIFAAVSGVIMPLYGLMLSRIITSFYKPPVELEKDTRFWALMFTFNGTVALFSFSGRTYLFSMAGARLINRVRMKIFERVVNMEISWFDAPENSCGAISARLSTDAARVRGLVGDALGLLVQNITTLIAGFILSFVANWQLSLIVVSLLPLIGFNGWFQIKFMKGLNSDSKVNFSRKNYSYRGIIDHLIGWLLLL